VSDDLEWVDDLPERKPEAEVYKQTARALRRSPGKWARVETNVLYTTVVTWRKSMRKVDPDVKVVQHVVQGKSGYLTALYDIYVAYLPVTDKEET